MLTFSLLLHSAAFGAYVPRFPIEHKSDIFHKQTINTDGVGCMVIASMVAAVLTWQSPCIAKSQQILLLSTASSWPFLSLI
jgi:hypothetical protein